MSNKRYSRYCDFCRRSYLGYGNRFCSVRCSVEFKKAVAGGLTPPKAQPELNVNCEPNHEPDCKPDWRDYFKSTTKMVQLQLAERTSVSQAQLQLPDKPAILTFSGCWHIGSRGTAYELLQEYIELILNADGVYLCLLGDEVENFFKFHSQEANEQQVLPPGIQKKVFAKIIKELKDQGKILYSVWSNHVGQREEKLLGYSPTEELFKDITFFDGKGTLELNVGNEKYKIFSVHKTKVSSADNPALGMKAELKRYSMYDRYDIVASAHLHYPTIAIEYIPEKTILLKAGTFKIDDLYARRNWKEGIIGTPTVLLYSNKHKTVVFEDLWSAITFKKAQEVKYGVSLDDLQESRIIPAN